MPLGFVKSISPKSFGFIRSDNKEYFFHRQDFNGDWNELTELFANSKQRVEVSFEVVANSPKGPRAANVMITP